MTLPILFAVDEDPVVVAELESQLVRRYGRDYRVESLRDPDQALTRLKELSETGADVALVLAGTSLHGQQGEELLDQVRLLHPHAKRALIVPANVWADGPAADAIRGLMALGPIDYYVPRLLPQYDAVFHEAVSDF